MRLRTGLIAIVALVLVMPFSARAMMPESKSMEVNGFFTFDHNSISKDGNSAGNTTFDLEPAVGYFFTPNWELLGKMIFDHESGFGDNSGTTNFGLTADVLYHFATSGSIVPFVGGGFGFLTNGGDANSNANTDNASIIAPELFAGIRLPFKQIVSVNFQGGYRHTSAPLGIDGASGNEFFLGAGFSFFFRGGIQ